MHQRVAVIDRAERLDLRRAVHHEAMNPPFEEIRSKEGYGNDDEFPGPEVAQVRDVNVKRGKADGVDEEDVKPAVIPTGDAFPIGFAIAALAVGHWCRG